MGILLIFVILGIGLFIALASSKKRKTETKQFIENSTRVITIEPTISFKSTRGTRYSVADDPNIEIPKEFVKKTKSEIIEMAFDHIFRTIECEASIKQKIRNEYIEALIKQQYSRCHDILRFNLTGIDFKWTWFDDWKRRFSNADKWPEAWRGISYDAIDVPENLHAVLEFVKVAEIRKALKAKGLEKVPTTRIQVQECALKHLTVSDLQAAIKERVSYFEALRDKNNQQAIFGLIGSSIDHAQNQLSRLVEIIQIKQEKPYIELKEVVYLSPSWNDNGLDRWVLEQVGDSLNDTIFPPYYPGDSISIQVDYSVRY